MANGYCQAVKLPTARRDDLGIESPRRSIVRSLAARWLSAGSRAFPTPQAAFDPTAWRQLLRNVRAETALERWERRGVMTPILHRAPWGDALHLLLPEPVSLGIYLDREWERGLTAFLHQYLLPGHTFFDIGAHFGYFSLMARSIVGPEGDVHAFEPTPRTYAVLSQNVEENCHHNITLQPLALWSCDRDLEFNDFGIRFSAYNSSFAPRLPQRATALEHAKTLTVPAVTVDHYVSETGARPDFIKVDAESAEMEILLGMETTMSELRPFISLEVGDEDVPGASRSADLLTHVMSYDYLPMEFRDGQIVLHQVQENYSYDNILLVPSP